MRDETLAVEANGICRRYGRRWALIDVSLRVPRGTVLLVAGRNGSGKSTLLRTLSTAIRADHGSARIEGYDLRRDTEAVRHRIALLTHHLHLYDSLTALENLQVAARFLGRDDGRRALVPLLEQVGLEERADDTPATFSAGMRKRLGLALVLAQEASVVFLDEPYGQLDPPGFRLVDRLLETLRKRRATVLVATHLIERTSPLCDQALVLEAGRLAWTGPAGDLVSKGGVDVAGLPEGGA
jgi:heme exporter protein A